MQISFLALLQRLGHRYIPPLEKHGRDLWEGGVFCVLLAFLLGILGKDAWVTSGALWLIAITLLGFCFFASLAKMIDSLARAKELLVAILRGPPVFFRFALIDSRILPVEDPVRKRFSPPPLAPAFSSLA